MGKKSKWFSNVKKALSPHSKKDQKLKKQLPDLNSSNYVENVVVPSPPPSIPPPQLEDVKLIVTSNESNVVPYSVPVAAAPAPEPEVTAIQTAVEVVHIAKPNRFVGKSNKEVAAIKIQTAFRGYLARRALRALRGLVRLKSLMEGPTVKRQAAQTLKCMQTLSRVQSQIQSRRMRMAEENQALQKQLLQKHAKELEHLRIGEEWDHSLQSKEQIEANLLNKYEAAMRRERAMAYSFTHQQTWKNSPKSAIPMFMNPGNPAWGWSWLERWTAAHPWESRGVTDRELNNGNSSTKNASRSIVGEISKSYARYQLNTDKLTPVDSEKQSPNVNQQSPSTPLKPFSSAAARKLKSASPRSSFGAPDDDARSMASIQSHRRHSIAGSVRDDESLGSSPSLPSYMVPTESARAKSRLQSPLAAEKNGTPEKDKASLGTAKKRLSYPASPARPRRHSGPPRVESNFNTESNSVVNGE